MDEKICRITARIIPEATPAEKAGGIIRTLGSGPQKSVPIDSLRRRVGRYWIDPGTARGVAIVGGTNHSNLAKFAGLDDFFGLVLNLRADTLVADLQNAFRPGNFGNDRRVLFD